MFIRTTVSPRSLRSHTVTPLRFVHCLASLTLSETFTPSFRNLDHHEPPKVAFVRRSLTSPRSPQDFETANRSLGNRIFPTIRVNLRFTRQRVTVDGLAQVRTTVGSRLRASLTGSNCARPAHSASHRSRSRFNTFSETLRSQKFAQWARPDSNWGPPPCQGGVITN